MTTYKFLMPWYFCNSNRGVYDVPAGDIAFLIGTKENYGTFFESLGGPPGWDGSSLGSIAIFWHNGTVAFCPTCVLEDDRYVEVI